MHLPSHDTVRSVQPIFVSGSIPVGVGVLYSFQISDNEVNTHVHLKQFDGVADTNQTYFGKEKSYRWGTPTDILPVLPTPRIAGAYPSNPGA